MRPCSLHGSAEGNGLTSAMAAAQALFAQLPHGWLAAFVADEVCPARRVQADQLYDVGHLFACLERVAESEAPRLPPRARPSPMHRCDGGGGRRSWLWCCGRCSPA